MNGIKNYDTLVDAIVAHGNIRVACPKGIFPAIDILNMFWFNVKEPSKVELPTASFVRKMWQQPAVVDENGVILVQMDNAEGISIEALRWADSGFVLMINDEAVEVK
jgi:hypothetical protein